MAACLGFSVTAAPAPKLAKVDFIRDIKPVMADTCFACHGFDANKRKGGLRLDVRAEALKAGTSGKPAIVPGKPEASEAVARLFTRDADDLMPPENSHKVLTAKQKELFRQWVAEGAEYQGHWAFTPPRRATLPAVKTQSWVRNPIDAFVLAALERKGLKPAPEADRRTLARRLSLDLTGLPPTPEEVEAFAADRSPRAYENYVAQLLNSPHWGEHRGRYWLDAARYADTHGLHFDNYREMWPYRDWVINAFNRNLPYDRFTREQLAGDLLPSPTREQLIATGFHRCNMTTNEGGTIEEENLANYAADRVTTTAWVWLGLTANCAQCHDHKFDPVTMKDFYSMAAFFRNTTQRGLDGNRKDSDPSVTVPLTVADERRWDALPDEIAVAKARAEERRQAARPAHAAWATTAAAQELDRDLNLPQLVVSAPLTEGNGTNVAIASIAPASIAATGPLTWKAGGRLGSAPVIAKSAHFVLGEFGDFERTNAFSFGAWVNSPKVGGGVQASILGRMDTEQAFRGWDLFQSDAEFVVHIVNEWPKTAIRVSTTGKQVKAGRWQHVFATYDGAGKGAGVKLFVDGVEAKVKVDNNTLAGSIRTPVPLRVGQRSKGQAFDGGQVQDVRVFARKLDGREINTLMKAGPLRSVLALTPEKRSTKEKDALFDHWLNTRDAQFKERAQVVAALEQERDAIRDRNPVTHVQREKMDAMPAAFILARGQYDKKREEVPANTIAMLNPMPKDAPRNRLGLAEWLNSPENPLPARVAVNRFWQELFGTGIVKSTEDFGIMGTPPTHPELLDWLAVEFRETGWDVKRLFTLIVTSATYRQAAVTTKEKLERDPQNSFFSRGPRFRMDAEMVRDYALAASGLLVRKVGGPSVRPYQPPGVWEAVAMPGSTTRDYKQDSGEALYRRSLYTFWKRTAPPASMDILNAPSRESCTVRRERTNTPLQALATLNDPQYVEAARRLAEQALTTSSDRRKAVEFMARRLLGRSLTSAEQGIVSSSLSDLEKHFIASSDAATQLIAVGESKADAKLPPAQLAALTMVANQLLNLDEVLNK